MTQDREALMVAQYPADLFKIESSHNIAYLPSAIAAKWNVVQVFNLRI